MFRTTSKTVATALLCATGLMTSVTAHAAEATASLAIKNHRFEPAELSIPANQRVKITVTNHDNTPEEIESHAMRVEKVIPGGRSAVVYVGPLKPGSYEFEGEFNKESAHGIVIAK